MNCVLVLFSLTVLLAKSETNFNEESKQLFELLFGNYERLRQDLPNLRPFSPKPDNFLGPNGMAFNSQNMNSGSKRGIPIGGFSPNPWTNGLSHHNPHHNPYYQPMGGFGSSPMMSHVMPHTFNLINSLRAGLSAGIPTYGFGYGVINDGFISSNQGPSFYPPFRSGPPGPETDDDRVVSESSPKGINKKA